MGTILPEDIERLGYMSDDFRQYETLVGLAKATIAWRSRLERRDWRKSICWRIHSMTEASVTRAGRDSCIDPSEGRVLSRRSQREPSAPESVRFAPSVQVVETPAVEIPEEQATRLRKGYGRV